MKRAVVPSQWIWKLNPFAVNDTHGTKKERQQFRTNARLIKRDGAPGLCAISWCKNATSALSLLRPGSTSMIIDRLICTRKRRRGVGWLESLDEVPEAFRRELPFAGLALTSFSALPSSCARVLERNHPLDGRAGAKSPLSRYWLPKWEERNLATSARARCYNTRKFDSQSNDHPRSHAHG